MRNASLSVSLFLSLASLSFGACASDGQPLGESETPCGIVACTADEADDNFADWTQPMAWEAGKFDREGVESAIAVATGDGVLDGDDIRDAFDAAGQNVGRGEMRAIREALEDDSYEVTDDARETALALAYEANLFDWEREILATGISYGGSELPAAVTALVARARLNGAIAYDVQEVDDDGEGVWNPYPAATPPIGNMTFDYTEITPAVLAADIAATDLEYQAITGSETAEYCNGGACQEYRRATYETRVGGTGNVSAHYDEVYHEDVYARGRSGQRWASNCAILSDGSLHCLPAARRSELQDLILTNPHLSRCNPYQGYEEGCRHLLYHGHVDIHDGVVTAIEMSGRVSKRAARGKAAFIDPISLFEAWGFEISPGLTIRYGNTSAGVPVRDAEAGVIREAD